VLHVPKAPNFLISIPRLAIGGGWVEFKGNGCQLHDKNSRIIGKGKLTNMFDARAELPNRESAQYASIRTHSWDQWHRLYGHISVNAITAKLISIDPLCKCSVQPLCLCLVPVQIKLTEFGHKSNEKLRERTRCSTLLVQLAYRVW